MSQVFTAPSLDLSTRQPGRSAEISVEQRVTDILVVHPVENAGRGIQIRTDFKQRFNNFISHPETAKLRFTDAELPRLIEAVATIAAQDTLSSDAAASVASMLFLISEDKRVGAKTVREALAKQILESDDPQLAIARLSEIPGRMVSHGLLEAALQARTAERPEIELLTLQAAGDRLAIGRTADPLYQQLLQGKAGTVEAEAALLTAVSRLESVSPEMFRELSKRHGAAETDEVRNAAAVALVKFAPESIAVSLARPILNPEAEQSNAEQAGRIAVALAERSDVVGLQLLLDAVVPNSPSGIDGTQRATTLQALYEKHGALNPAQKRTLERAIAESLPHHLSAASSDAVQPAMIEALARVGGVRGSEALSAAIASFPEDHDLWKHGIRELGYRGHAPKTKAGLEMLNSILSEESLLDGSEQEMWAADGTKDLARRMNIVKAIRAYPDRLEGSYYLANRLLDEEATETGVSNRIAIGETLATRENLPAFLRSLNDLANHYDTPEPAEGAPEEEVINFQQNGARWNAEAASFRELAADIAALRDQGTEHVLRFDVETIHKLVEGSKTLAAAPTGNAILKARFDYSPYALYENRGDLDPFFNEPTVTSEFRLDQAGAEALERRFTKRQMAVLVVDGHGNPDGTILDAKAGATETAAQLDHRVFGRADLKWFTHRIAPLLADGALIVLGQCRAGYEEVRNMEQGMREALDAAGRQDVRIATNRYAGNVKYSRDEENKVVATFTDPQASFPSSAKLAKN